MSMKEHHKDSKAQSKHFRESIPFLFEFFSVSLSPQGSVSAGNGIHLLPLW